MENLYSIIKWDDDEQPYVPLGTQLPFRVDVESARALLSMGRTAFLERVYTGVIPSQMEGKRRLFLVADLAAYAKSQDRNRHIPFEMFKEEFYKELTNVPAYC
jgi:hypothetical protein